MDTPLMELLEAYDTLVVLDTETSGLRFEADEIIELAAAALRRVDGAVEVTARYDRLIRLSPGRRLDPRITQLTGISQADLEEGVSKEEACRDFAQLLGQGRTLIAAYNAHFDMSFLYHLLRRHGDPGILREPDFLDAMSIYKDRRPYPHKLRDAIIAYALEGTVVNSHRAIDDVLATVEVLRAMDAEKPDLLRYVNLFGYNPKYGVQGRRIGSVRYAAQPFEGGVPLYERAPQPV